MTITQTIAAIEAAAPTQGGIQLGPALFGTDFQTNGPLLFAYWQPYDIVEDASAQSFGSDYAMVLDGLLLILTGRGAEVDRAQRLRVARIGAIRARAEADTRDAEVAAIEAEPTL